jgi:hypothetical protein
VTKTFIGIPTYDGRANLQVVDSVMRAGGENVVQHAGGSLLAHVFNQLWCMALNSRPKITHFLMLHSDIVVTEAGWLDRMHVIMHENEADVLSAVVPIKGPEGTTSTAKIAAEQWPPQVDRLGMRDCLELPETFTHEWLALNTGLMLVDLRKPWVERCHFEIRDRVIRGEDGIFRPYVLSEDWNFSLQARALGAKLFATRAIQLKHQGTGDWESPR